MNPADHAPLVAAGQAAGRVGTPQAPGPFTLFAPTGTVKAPRQPGNMDQLTRGLTAHVVSGARTGGAIDARLAAGGGRIEPVTVFNDAQAIGKRGATTGVIDANGNGARITIADVTRADGVIRAADTVPLSTCGGRRARWPLVPPG